MEEDDRRRALSDKFPVATWPPEVGARLHWNSGWPHTSWTGEVRAVVDDEVAVVLKCCPALGGRVRHEIINRTSFLVSRFRIGPLPRALTRRK